MARSDNKLTGLDVQKALGREFPEEMEKHGLPSEQQVRNWAKDSPNLPEEMREKGFLGGFEALEDRQPHAGGYGRTQMPVFPPPPSVTLQPIPAVQNWQLVGLGHLPLKEESTGSNPVCATTSYQ